MSKFFQNKLIYKLLLFFILILFLTCCKNKTEIQKDSGFEKIDINVKIISKTYNNKPLMVSETNNMLINIANLTINGFKFQYDGKNVKLITDSEISYNQYEITNESNNIVDIGNKSYMIKNATLKCKRKKIDKNYKSISINKSTGDIFSTLMIEFVKNNSKKGDTGYIFLSKDIYLDYQKNEANGSFTIVLNK